MRAETKILPEAIQKISEAILDANGREVLCVGSLDVEGYVSAITVAARGHESAVPALAPFMERGDVVIHNHPSGNLEPSDADLSVASHLGNQGIGFFIVNSGVTEVYVVAEPVRRDRRVPLDTEILVDLLSPGGALDALMADYEPRDAQIAMVEAVSACFNENGICVAEAGTGVGKSLAYLLPAIMWAAYNDERVVVATATINLQQQLIEKDIPLAMNVTGFEVPVALVKGRGNYLCLKRLSDVMVEGDLLTSETGELAALKEWADQTTEGSRSDLPFTPDPLLWSQICSEPDTCIGLKCTNREECFVLKARRDAAAANILVVNHHLLFSDIAVRLEGVGFEESAVLPPFKRLIFDEAHAIEQSATSFFSTVVSKPAILKQINRIYRVSRAKASGLALKLQTLSDESTRIKNVPEAVQRIRDAADALNAGAASAMSVNSLRFVSGESNPVWDVIQDYLATLQDAILDLTSMIESVVSLIYDVESDDPTAFEATIVVRRLLSFAALCEQMRGFENDRETVYWLNKRRGTGGEVIVDFTATPLNVSHIMQEAVFAMQECVVCTSATLSIQNNFDYWLGRVGLLDFPQTEPVVGVFPSPFPYEDRVLLGIPRDAPDPTTEGYYAFAAGFTADAIEISEGKALVLFTSYEMLSYVYEFVKPRLDVMGIIAMKQGDDDRARLLTSFNADAASVLFATDSFWQGVDVPGEALRLVIICRLPFRVPTDPVHVARMDAIRRRGGNPFVELALPEAVTKFKQGFGRLMRRSTDRGAVVVLDSRISHKSYGSMFIESLPKTGLSTGESSGVLRDLEAFLYPAE